MLTLVDVFGFGAAGATLATFAQRRMLPMRVSALAANVLFIGYGALGPFYPVLVLHALLLPVNLWRLAPGSRRRTWLAQARGARTSLLQQWSKTSKPCRVLREEHA